MKEIADASGVGRTTVYRHFSSRDELYQAMYERAVVTTWVAAEQVVERGEPVEPTLFLLAERMVEVGLGYRFLMKTAHTGSAAMQASRRSPRSPIRRYFEEAQRRGEIRADLTVGWILSMFQALCLVAMQDLMAGHQDESATTDLLAESLISLLLPRDRRG